MPPYQGTIQPGAPATVNLGMGSGGMGAGTSPSPAPATNPEAPPVAPLAPSAPAANNGASSAPPPVTAPTPARQDPEPPANDDGNPTTTDGDPSAGCGASQGIPANVNVPNTILTFPPGYDGNTPFPLLFGFHGASRTNMDMRVVDSRTMGSELEGNYVVAFMKSAGNGWDLATDYPRFEAALDQILAERCIDEGALFAMGHSSGAQFIAQMLGDNRARETRFAAVAPVSSSLFQNPAWSPVPTLLIHGLRDTQRPNDLNGAQDISQYARSNQCSGGTQPVGIGTCSSLAGGVAVNPGCVEYADCAAPTLFCNHDDPNYLDNGAPTNHGWPCFANSELFSFFESVR